MFNLAFFFLLLTRFWSLDLKPPHHDESINGWFVMQNWAQGFYTYDPNNYHGPLLFYLFQIGELFGGAQATTYRFITVGFSCLTLLLLSAWCHSRLRLSRVWVFLFALSPAFLFFSKSAIHESPFVFFVLFGALAWIDFWVFRRDKSLIYFLYALTGALLLKETFVIPLAFGGLVSLPILLKKESAQRIWQIRQNLFLHLAICISVIAAIFTGFGQNPNGALDFFRAFLPWMKTGVHGQGHEKEFLYFIKMIWTDELVIFICLILAIGGVLFLPGWRRAVCMWSLFILFLYSWLQYKTPWCLISLQIPLWIAGLSVLSQFNLKKKLAIFVLMFSASLINFSTFKKLNYQLINFEHPYVYVQTANQAKIFVDSLIRQTQKKPELLQAKMHLASFEPWPFPWWLQVFSNQASRVLKQGFVAEQDIYIVDLADQAIFEPSLQDNYWKAEFTVRDSREPVVAYLRKSFFDCPFEACQEVNKW